MPLQQLVLLQEFIPTLHYLKSSLNFYLTFRRSSDIRIYSAIIISYIFFFIFNMPFNLRKKLTQIYIQILCIYIYFPDCDATHIESPSHWVQRQNSSRQKTNIETCKQRDERKHSSYEIALLTLSFHLLLLQCTENQPIIKPMRTNLPEWTSCSCQHKVQKKKRQTPFHKQELQNTANWL